MPSQGPQLKLSTIGSSLDEVFVGDESSDEQAASRVKIAIGRINLKHMFFKYISGEFVGVGECCWQLLYVSMHLVHCNLQMTGLGRDTADYSEVCVPYDKAVIYVYV